MKKKLHLFSYPKIWKILISEERGHSILKLEFPAPCMDSFSLLAEFSYGRY